MTSRSAVLLAAVQKEILERKAHLDAATDIGEVTITVKLQAGTTWVRGTQYCEERVVRTRSER